jgi:hypothetical protein
LTGVQTCALPISIGRGFLLFNIQNNKYNYYSVTGSFNNKIGQIESLDSKAKLFVFNIYSLKENEPTILRVMDLSTENAKIINEKKIDNSGIAITDKLIFAYYENMIYVMNSNFESKTHPLVNIFDNEKQKDYGSTIELIIHPNQPLAIIKEEKYDEHSNFKTSIWVISWRESDMKSDKPKMIKLLSEESFGYTFSYDGKWLWFINASTSPRSLILMPVDPDLPNFIGKPIYLGEVPAPENANGDGMTRNPSGLVVSECEGYKGQCCLKKWDFTEAEKLIEKNK